MNLMSASELVEQLRLASLKLAIAESITGGALAAELVSVPGASDVFLGAVVAYQTQLKHSLVGVPQKTLNENGPVDAEVAALMAEGVRHRMAKDLGLEITQVIGVATTGVAGPEGQNGQPVGLVFTAIDSEHMSSVTSHNFEGDRASIRHQTVAAVIDELLEHFSTL